MQFNSLETKSIWGEYINTVLDQKNKKTIFAELEQSAALKYLYGWLRNHPKYGVLARPGLSDSLYYADVSIDHLILIVFGDPGGQDKTNAFSKILDSVLKLMILYLSLSIKSIHKWNIYFQRLKNNASPCSHVRSSSSICKQVAKGRKPKEYNFLDSYIY